ncbi:adenylate/guanylate cyclase domain-containing protein [Chloroflexota bacterium]
MQATFSSYTYIDSINRINEILNSPDFNYEDKDSIPSRDTLSFTNGFYVNCSAMFVDLRDSTGISQKYKRPTLARMYRSFISELVAVMRNHTEVSEININGDCVWGVYDTPHRSDIDSLFDVAAMASSLIDILSWKLEKNNLSPIKAGIGLSFGRALMIKAGYKGSTVNDVVWMGDVVNESSELCSYGDRSWSAQRTMVSSSFYNNLNEKYQALLTWNSPKGCYQGYIINTVMNDWLNKQKSR